jgi:hypothetical protein
LLRISCLTSIRTTFNFAIWLATWAIPIPIWPAPTTPSFLISFFKISIF